MSFWIVYGESKREFKSNTYSQNQLVKWDLHHLYIVVFQPLYCLFDALYACLN